VLAQVDRWVQPLTLSQGLAAWGAANGVELREGVEVTGLGGSGLETTAGPIEVDAAVIAAGPQSPALMRSLGVRVRIVPARGYSVTCPREGSATPGRALYLADALVGVSTFEDAVRLAGVFELGYADTAVSERRLTAMLRTVDPFFDGWRASEAPRETAWAGLRPVTSDGLPLIGRSPRDPRVFLATGHGMLGITLAPATAALLAPLVLEGRADPALTPFDPARRA
jgi:D-amino-acid dehydrogenase